MRQRNSLVALGAAALMSAVLAMGTLAAAPSGSVSGTCLREGNEWNITGIDGLPRSEAMQTLAYYHQVCDGGTMEWTWTPAE